MQSEKTQSAKNANLSKVKVKCTLPIYSQLIMFLSFLLLIYLGFENYQLLKRIDGVDQLNKKLISSIEQTTKKQLSHVFSQLGMQLNTVVQKKTDHLLTNIFDNLTASARATIDVANSKLLRNKENAEDAFAVAKKRIQSGDFINGRIYIINAINHDSANIKYIKELMNLYHNHYRNDINVLNEVKSIVELALFQLDSKDVDMAIKYLSELNSNEQKIISSLAEVSSEKTDWNAEFNKIKEVDMNEISTNAQKLNGRYRKLNAILTNIQNNEADDKGLITSIIDEMEKTKNLYQLTAIAEKVKNYIMLLDSESDYASQTASARLLAASSSMSFFWEHDLRQLPQNLKNLIQNELPSKLKSIEKKVKEAKSRPYFVKANKILGNALNYKSGNYQDKIEEQQKAIKSAIDLMHKILFEDYQKKIRQNIKVLQDNITVYRREQYVAYQKWASGVILNVFNNINNILILIDDDANRIFDNSDLPLIDLRLSSPEVSQAYNKVFQKIIDELSSKKAFRIYKVVMTSQKKTLEDF